MDCLIHGAVVLNQLLHESGSMLCATGMKDSAVINTAANRALAVSPDQKVIWSYCNILVQWDLPLKWS